MSKFWSWLKGHWQLAAIALAVVAAIVLGKRLADLLPRWFAQGVFGRVTDSNPFRVVDGNHVVANDGGTWRVVDVGKLGVPASRVTGVSFAPGGRATVQVSNPPLGGVAP